MARLITQQLFPYESSNISEFPISTLHASDLAVVLFFSFLSLEFIKSEVIHSRMGGHVDLSCRRVTFNPRHFSSKPKQTIALGNSELLAKIILLECIIWQQGQKNMEWESFLKNSKCEKLAYSSCYLKVFSNLTFVLQAFEPTGLKQHWCGVLVCMYICVLVCTYVGVCVCAHVLVCKYVQVHVCGCFSKGAWLTSL